MDLDLGNSLYDVSEIVRNLLAEHGTTAAAAEALIAEAQSDPALYGQITQDALRSLCFAAVRRVVGNERNTVWREAAMAPVIKKRATALAPVSEWGAAVGRSLLDQYHVKNGKALGDATAEEVLETIANLEEKAADMMSKGRWLRLILSKVTPGKIVRECVTEDEVHRLQADVLNGSERAA